MNNRFSDRLLSWYQSAGRHDLPWQKNKTSYRVWVSEIMLQQTQVKTVIEYYKKFMKRFPNLKSLGTATQDDVLSYWTGLGYYSRARNLHKTAQIVYYDLKGRFPKTPDELIALPGIGRSTAHAILSIVHNDKHPILDGNVKRVICRYKGITTNPYEKETEQTLWGLANDLMPKDNAGAYTQAIMDLGATLCTRSKPQCMLCPVHQDCIANRDEIQHLIPKKKKSKKLPVKQTSFVIYTNQDSVLLEKRENKGLWGGLWVLPQEDRTDGELFTAFRHTFTHFHLDIRVIKSHTIPSDIKISKTKRWFKHQALQTVGLPQPIAKTLNQFFASHT